jgi:AcrR family transcriptional regulator
VSGVAGQPPPKAGYHHGDLREALLVAADLLIREEGLPGLTLRACARRAGVSHAAPKHHFADLADLLAEVAARSFDRLTTALQAARAGVGDDPDERFIAIARTYVDFARQYPDHFRLMFRSDLLSRCNTALRSASARTYAEMIDGVTAQRGEPDVAPEELGARIQDHGLVEDILLGWSYVHGYAQLLLEGQLAVFAREENLEDFLQRTLATGGRRLGRLFRDTGSDS